MAVGPTDRDKRHGGITEMSSFKDMNLNLINPHKKRGVDRDAPIMLRSDDYKYSANHMANAKRIKLPTLLSYKLPSGLLAKLNLQQISLDDLNACTKLRLHNAPVDSAGRNPSSSPAHDNSPVPGSRINSPLPTKSSRFVDEQAAQKEISLHTTSKASSGASAFKEENESLIRTITDLADGLKKSSISLYQSKNYMASIVDFTQSYILFILALRLKETQNETHSVGAAETVKQISRKRRDWINVLLFGEKIISNFTKIIEADRGRERERKMNLNGLVHILGFIHYTNGFIQLHLGNTILKYMDILKDEAVSDENINNARIAKLLSKYEETLESSKKALQVGENNLGLFVIAKEYPHLWSQSFTKISSVKQNTIVLPYDLNVAGPSQIPKFKTGVNYCLPICSHLWDLNNMINFSGFFLKEWCLRQSLKHSLIFG